MRAHSALLMCLRRRHPQRVAPDHSFDPIRIIRLTGAAQEVGDDSCRVRHPAPAVPD